MHTLRAIALVGFGCCIGLLIPGGASKLHDRIYSFDRRWEDAFRSIKYGMERDRVIALLGSPVKETSEFQLAQMEGYEFEYAAAARSGAKYFLIWTNGTQFTYAIGFDENDKAVIRAFGTS